MPSSDEDEAEKRLDRNQNGTGIRSLDSLTAANSCGSILSLSPTVAVSKTTNGARTTLHYPIVTEPSERRRSRRNGETYRGISATLRKATREFLGLESDDSDQEVLWTERRIRLANRMYGGVVDPQLAAATLTLPRRRSRTSSAVADALDQGAVSLSDRYHATTYPRYKRSVVNYVADGLTTLGRRISGRSPATVAAAETTVPTTTTLSRSFSPAESRLAVDAALSEDETDSGYDFHQQPELFFDRGPHPPSAEGRLMSSAPLNLVHPAVPATQIGLSRIAAAAAADVVDKRVYGMGVVGEVTGRDFQTLVRSRPHVQQQMDEMDDYRPYFTYWVTSVQVIILIIALALYGFGPVGVELNQSTSQVLSRGLYIEEVDYYEPANFWLGPRPADLIHLGAKFSPCMRSDDVIVRERAAQLAKERDTGCCVRNDHSGCVQTDRDECSSLVSTFHKWTKENPGPDGRLSGPVCGQDPQYCTAPLSSYADTWPDDLTGWPICHVSSLPKPISYWGLGGQKLSPAPSHMTCERIARPCCIGIHGNCEIRTKEFCDFVHGHFHAEATLCSQVSCIQDVCGMLPFLIDADRPDQIYRLLTSLFLHAGILHLLITLLVQLYLMRDMEKLCGPVRIAIIYLGSGMAGNLASALFIPYRAESGPAGAQFGILASQIVEVLNVWPALKSPGVALGKLLLILVLLLLLGLLPWVDNYAHIVGFFTGFLLSYALMPYIAFDRKARARQRRVILITACLLAALTVFGALLAVFYAVPAKECEWCKYLTCIPFTEDFCADQNINFKKDDPIVNF